MSALEEHVDDYLRLRRALGFKLERHGQMLPQLVAYLEAAGASTITRELAIAWARLPAGAHPRHWAARLAVARGFAAYLQTIDPATEIPPADVFAVRYQRPAPYLWSERTSAGCWRRRARCGRHCGRPATRRCSACSPSPACASARRSRSSATTSTSMTA